MLPLHRLSAFPVLHELYGRQVAQCRAQPLPVVKHLGVFKHHRLHLIACTKAFAMHPLVLEAAEPVLRRGIVPVAQCLNETLIAMPPILPEYPTEASR